MYAHELTYRQLQQELKALRAYYLELRGKKNPFQVRLTSSRDMLELEYYQLKTWIEQREAESLLSEDEGTFGSDTTTEDERALVESYLNPPAPAAEPKVDPKRNEVYCKYRRLGFSTAVSAHCATHGIRPGEYLLEQDRLERKRRREERASQPLTTFMGWLYHTVVGGKDVNRAGTAARSH